MRRLDWTPELVGRFWDGVAQTRGLAQQSFGRLGGRHLLQAVRWHLVPGRRHLDFGGGDGDFAGLLAEAGYPTAVYEPSAERAALVAARLAGRPGFLGVVGHEFGAAAADQRFDVIFLVEVIEHVLDADLGPVLARLDLLLAPGGKIIITTPNDEDLEQNFAFEPGAGVLFHRWQHQRAFTRDTLSALMAGHGFAPELVHEIELTDRIFAARGAGLGCRPEFANLFNTDRPLTIGDGHSLVWIGGRVGEISVEPAETSWRSSRLELLAETRLLVPGAAAAETPVLPAANPGRCPPGWRELRLAPAQLFQDQGLLYGSALPRKLPAGDSAAAPLASPVELYEDGRPLGPAHCQHDRIRALGAGRYSHWGESLFFAASDGSDPRRNGRTYTLRWPKRPVTAVGPLRFVLPAEAIEPLAGRAFRVILPDGMPPGDRGEDDRSGTLALQEDHLPLGPAHTPPDRIIDAGRGRYGQQGRVLVFSSSDDTDPRRNGRRYVLDWA
jgi:2-polyprenyl-3-methyl-5-hydroxy-6-metoxy-1,4-benzoquinol methylase